MESVLDSRVYLAIDLKSYYASVEALARGLDPLTVNLLVADETRHLPCGVSQLEGPRRTGTPAPV